MAHIKLKKLTGIKVGDNTTTASADFQAHVNGLAASKTIVFAGNDYKGTFKSGTTKGTGDLDLYFEGPENHFEIKDVKINMSSTTHTLSANSKEATIELIKTTDNKVTEKDSGWFTTELTGTAGSLKFGEWNDFDLSNQSYVDISFT
ncbi:hypothetical protein [Wolbachia endosymbiont of Folsomia candida]|uniref:hypothetical protein n=1 Tax=Wolbachia endosymbiont of Folsomia candida TaxID=169402 RepID=UPI000AED20D4|nr:hypothetical protein [Wolbachia endosymbiont of Folsomia candida]APR98837.1 hypothetical protein ASM33_06455 [Wolbachia endosymbiont of Folsomia candida]